MTAWWFSRGQGSNGKTTIVDAIREAVGNDYAVTMPERTLLARQGDHPTDLMTLRGARLALMEEFPELGHLNVKRLKTFWVPVR
jgi:phage/plasmid-associated DNA primase